MLILAGVSINLVLGNNGIIAKAKDTNIATEIAKVQDAIDFKILDNNIDNAVGNGDNNIYRIEGFVQETEVNDNGEDKDIYVITDLSKIGTSSSIGNGTLTDKSNKDLSDLKDILIIDQDNKVYYIDKNGEKYGNGTINGFKKIVASSAEWEVEGNKLVKYLGTANDIVIPNYVNDVKITTIGSKNILEPIVVIFTSFT